MAAVIFGLATIVSGGSVLFGTEDIRARAGAIVPFVLWFNFVAGFAYCIAGIGLLKGRDWSIRLSVLIAIATVLVFVLLLFYAGLGGKYEVRTLAAMTLRSIVWIGIAFVSLRNLKNNAADRLG